MFLSGYTMFQANAKAEIGACSAGFKNSHNARKTERTNLEGSLEMR